MNAYNGKQSEKKARKKIRNTKFHEIGLRIYQTRIKSDSEKEKKIKEITGFGEFVGIGGFIEEIGGVFIFGTEQTPAAELFLCFLVEIICSG